jgi:GTPase
VAKAILSDTVGFVSDLPTQLVAAFRATLEEVISADVIVHVRDISHGDAIEQAADVVAVLAGLGIDAHGKIPIVEAWNKIDRLGGEDRERWTNEAARRGDVVTLSALTGEGVAALETRISAALTAGRTLYRIELDPTDGAGAAWLYAHGAVETDQRSDDGAVVTVLLSEADYARFRSRAR